MKMLTWHLLSAVALAGSIEFYIWSQSSSGYDSNYTKTVLFCGYLVLAVGSQLLFSWFVGYNLWQASLMNFILVAVISIWLTFSAFVLHPGLAKGQRLNWPSVIGMLLRYLLTIGLATFLARLLTAAMVKQLRSR